MDHTTPGIPVGFTEIFISEMLQVVVNNQFSDWVETDAAAAALPLTKDKIFLSLAAPAAKRRARGSGRILGAGSPLALRLRAASKTACGLPLSACLPLKMN